MPELPQPPFASLHRRLLAGGIAPRRARRLIEELRGHYLDLLAEQKLPDVPPETAARRALERLGDEDLLAGRLLAQRQLLSWSRRWPWAVYGLAPLLLYPLALAVCCLLIAVVATLCHRFAPSSAHATLQALAALRVFSLYAPPALLTAVTLWLALQRGVARGWIAVSVVLLPGFGSLTNVDVTLHVLRAGIGVSSRLPAILHVLLTRFLPNALGGGALAALGMLYVRAHQRAVNKMHV